MENKTERAAEVVKEYERLSTSRGNFESHWQEIAERCMPSVSTLFQNKSGQFTKGEKRNSEIYDSTAALALGKFGSILDSLLTPSNATWHRVGANDPALRKNREVKLYFEEVNRTLFAYRYAPKANFVSQNQMTYTSLGAFGTGSLFADELWGEAGIRYRNIHLGELLLDENHQGQVDKAIRRFNMTARQIKQKWPETCPEDVLKAIETTPEKEFEIVHRVCPRKDYDPNRKDFKGMRFESLYVSVSSKAELSEGGYEVFPYTTPRYMQAPNEVYGRSPAMDVLPAIKTLNEQKKTMLKQGHRAVDPVLLTHDDGILDTFSLKPGAINAGGVSQDGRPLVHALPTGNISLGKEMMEEERRLINDAFLVNLFQILVDTPQMSATEVLERTREKGLLLAPTIGRVQAEHLGTLIEREIDILSRQGLLPPMPPALREAGGAFKIDYDSPLSRAARAEEASGTMRSVQSALEIVNVTQNPEPLDYFDWDVIVPEMSEIHGAPARFMRSLEQVAAIRQGRAQQAQQAQMVEAAPAVAGVIKATK